MEIIPPTRMVADSVEVIAGTTSSSVSDLQTQYDGNIYHIDEVATTPGIDLRINFINIIRFSKITFSAYYDGRAAHYVEMQLYNYVTGEWETYTTIEISLGLNIQSFETADFEEHIKEGKVIMRFCHPMQGIAPDDFYIDYVALLR